MAHKKGENWWEKYANDPRPTEELIQAAIADWDKDYDPDYWPRAVTILHARGDRATLEAAVRLCNSMSAKERAVGADLLGEFGFPERTLPDECRKVLIGMLEVEGDAEVLASICSAFSHHERNRAVVQAISRFKNHPDEDVRFGVVIGLLWCQDEGAISVLLELTSDADEDVRDWATFGIGQIIDGADQPERFDTPAIREALFNRLDDSHWETSFEALAGLALRRDVRVVDRIVTMLVEDNPMAKSELCEALREILQHYTGSQEMLGLALSRCQEDTEK